jgi:hypothetical protein
MALASWLDAISQGPNRFPGPSPLPLALVMDLHASKTLCMGRINHRCINSYSLKLWPQECGDTQDDGGGISIHNIGGVFIVIFVGIYHTFLSLQYYTASAKTQYRKFETNIPRKETARLQSQFLYVHVSVTIYIFPWSVCLFGCRKISVPNVGIRYEPPTKKKRISPHSLLQWYFSRRASSTWKIIRGGEQTRRFRH